MKTNKCPWVTFFFLNVQRTKVVPWQLCINSFLVKLNLCQYVSVFCFLSNSCFLAWALSSCLQKKTWVLTTKSNMYQIGFKYMYCKIEKRDKTYTLKNSTYLLEKSKELTIIGKNLYDNIPFWKTISLLGPMQQILDIQFIHSSNRESCLGLKKMPWSDY